RSGEKRERRKAEGKFSVPAKNLAGCGACESCYLMQWATGYEAQIYHGGFLSKRCLSGQRVFVDLTFLDSPPFFKEGLGVVLCQDKKDTEGSYKTLKALIKGRNSAMKKRYHFEQKNPLASETTNLKISLLPSK